jgi:hypothetical protein
MNAKVTVGMLTIYLTLYVIVFAAGLSDTLLVWMYLASPFLLVWMVYRVLKDDAVNYPELPEDEEWGYSDKPKGELRLF